MDYLPIFLDLRGRKGLVVGGSDTAARKAALMLQAGAWVTAVTPGILAPAFAELAGTDRLIHLRTDFTDGHLEGMDVVFAVSGDEALDRRVHDAARARHIPVNVADRPGLCSFIMPSIIDRSPVMVAVSSGGEAPVLSRLLRARLETLIPAGYGRLAALAGRFKKTVREKFTSTAERRKFWERAFLSPISEMVFSGREQEAEAGLQAMLQAGEGAPATGEVYLVGAGPGNPDLLTFRALRLMQQADVVVYDRLVSPPILEMCRRDADRLYVGKERDKHAVPQGEINMVLVRLAREGKRVLRLKGGDPFIFGRGGEEIETLREHGVPFQVVPAVTAAAGVASYAGIPLTHRDHAQALVLVTGHLKDGSMDLDWDMLCRPRQTIVIYMGLKGLVTLCEQMMRHGLPGDTPAAIVQQGTTLNQKTVTGTLASLPTLAAQADLKPPTLIIVGSVVSLHAKLNWFHPDPGADDHWHTPLDKPASLEH
ncbi:MAG TPA: siroheme synthase CysG [Thiobacillaceae bacterium]|nr:siroheme synthase CysG [Thiobacillaceae bacterium]HNU64121.1 siroheme synthase CysG [Thiobacillaceae bacterium]